MKTQINTYIFDCFGVIFDPVLYGWYRDNRIKRGFVDVHIKDILEKFDLGEYTEVDIVNYFSKYDGINSTREEIMKQIDGYLSIDTELVETIKELKSNNNKIALLSNGNASFFERKIYPSYPEFKSMFDEIVISSNVGIVKPHSDIYKYTLKKVNSKPGESLFVDDSQINVDGAIAVGMQGFLFTNHKSFKDKVSVIKE